MREKRYIFSLNLISYLAMLGFDYQLECDNNLFYAMLDDSDNLQQVVNQYKQDYKLQEFLHSFADLRKRINDMREKYNA